MAIERRFIRSFLCAGLFLGLAAGNAWGHLPLFGVGTVSRLVFKEDRILLTFDLSYADLWAQAEMLAIDKNKSSAVEEDEATAYTDRQWQEKIAPRLRAKLDGKELVLLRAASRHEGLAGEIYGVPFSLYYELELVFPQGRLEAGTTHLFELEDTVVKDETPAQPIYLVPYQGHGESDGRFQRTYVEPREALIDAQSLSDRLDGPRLVLQFSFTGGNNAAPAVASAMPPRAAVDPGAEPARRDDIDTAILRYGSLSFWEMVLWVLLAAGYGAAHALAPGHGKSMVAAYLIGTRGRIRDAVILGAVTTLTHTGSVFLFGLAILALTKAGTTLSQGTLSNMVIVGAQMLAGILLLGLGLILFFRRLPAGEGGNQQGHDHDHDHGHAHGHSHSHDHAVGLLQGGTPRLRDLLTIGFTGGLVPCPAGLTVICTALQYPDRLVFGLLLLLVFSLGLGSVLVAIGVLLITGRSLARPALLAHPFFKALPALSALFVAGLGAYFCVSTYLAGKEPLRALLRLMGSWVG